jgi:aminomethyltransferase
VIADLEVFRTGADLVLACPPETLDDVLGTLLRARFRKKVALDPAGYALVWGDADGALAELATPIGVERLLAAAPTGGAAADGTWELARIEAGMARFGHEFTSESMPAEAGLEERAISFTKGCYPGQEPVARLHYRGHANRGVRGVRFGGEPAALGTTVTVDGADVGRVTSVADSPRFGPIGLAVLRRQVADGALGDAGGTALTVVGLPFS